MDALQTFLMKVQTQILEPFVTLLALLAFALFVWGVVQFIAASDDEEKRKTGQQHIIWGIIGLVILFGANGIIRLLEATILKTIGGG